MKKCSKKQPILLVKCMKKNNVKPLLFISIVAFLIIFNIIIGFSSQLVFANMNVRSGTNDNSAEIVMEVNSKRVLYEKNTSKKMYMASTTKILTAITIIENMDLSKNISVTKKTTGIEGSSIYLEEGEVLSVQDLLYGLMLRSGNDCAETLAIACCGSIEEFSTLMNEKARKIGAKNSNFVNPHGLHDDNHYTTAYDLALISSYAIKNPDFKRIVSTTKTTIPFTTKNTKRVLINKNKMLTNYDGATGIKTGYTKKAGRCLVTSAQRNGLELVCVVLNCYDMWEKTSLLLDKSFKNYSYKQIINSNEIIDFIKVNNEDKIGVYVKNSLYYPLTNDEENQLITDIKYTFNKDVFIKKGSNIGKINIYLKNNLIFSQKIYNIIDIKN